MKNKETIMDIANTISNQVNRLKRMIETPVSTDELIKTKTNELNNLKKSVEIAEQKQTTEEVVPNKEKCEACGGQGKVPMPTSVRDYEEVDCSICKGTGFTNKNI